MVEVEVENDVMKCSLTSSLKVDDDDDDDHDDDFVHGPWTQFR